jgi:putative transposase
MRYYQQKNIAVSFSNFIRFEVVEEKGINHSINTLLKGTKELIQIVAYCIMPTHIHLILKQLEERGITTFMSNLLNSYSRYFNIKHKRKGPLWEGNFKSVLVKNDEQLLHLTRYIHLNPVTAYLVDKPEDWLWSSYNEYLSKIREENRICKYDDILNIKINSYKEFVENRIAYQRELKIIKELLVDEIF